MTCVVDGCGRPARTRRCCTAHYYRLRIHGDTFPHVPIGAARYGCMAESFPVAPLLERKPAGLSWTRYAERLGITRRTICRWRNNPATRLSLDRADRYALALDQDLDDIWTTP